MTYIKNITQYVILKNLRPSNQRFFYLKRKILPLEEVVLFIRQYCRMKLDEGILTQPPTTLEQLPRRGRIYYFRISITLNSAAPPSEQRGY